MVLVQLLGPDDTLNDPCSPTRLLCEVEKGVSPTEPAPGSKVVARPPISHLALQEVQPRPRHVLRGCLGSGLMAEPLLHVTDDDTDTGEAGGAHSFLLRGLSAELESTACTGAEHTSRA